MFLPHTGIKFSLLRQNLLTCFASQIRHAIYERSFKCKVRLMRKHQYRLESVPIGFKIINLAKLKGGSRIVILRRPCRFHRLIDNAVQIIYLNAYSIRFPARRPPRQTQPAPGTGTVLAMQKAGEHLAGIFDPETALSMRSAQPAQAAGLKNGRIVIGRPADIAYWPPLCLESGPCTAFKWADDVYLRRTDEDGSGLTRNACQTGPP